MSHAYPKSVDFSLSKARRFCCSCGCVLLVPFITGQGCGGGSPVVPARGIPQGVYSGTANVTIRMILYRSNGSQQTEDFPSGSSSMSREFGPNGDWLSTSGLPVAPGDYRTLSAGPITGEERVTRVDVGNEEIIVAGNAVVLMTSPTTGQVLPLNGTFTEVYTFVPPNSIQVSKQMSAISEVYGGERIEFQSTTIATLYR